MKKNIPGLYLWDEEGGAVLACGSTKIFQEDWDTAMICDLISQGRTKGEEVPRIMLEDGREAVVVTIGTQEKIRKTAPTLVQMCLAQGNVYG